jgi:hypothetical protein
VFTSNFAKRLLRRLGQECGYLVNEISTIASSYRESFEYDVNQIIDLTRKLEETSEGEIQRIMPSLIGVARAYVSCSWWARLWKVLKVRKRVLASIPLLISIVLTCIVVPLPHPPLNSTDGAGTQGIFLAMGILALREIIHSKTGYRATLVLKIIETALAITFLATFNRWSASIERMWRAAVHGLTTPAFAANNHLAAGQASEALEWALWVIAIIGLLGFVVRVISFGIKIEISESGNGYNQAEQLSSSIIVAFLKVALAADTLSVLLSRESDPEEFGQLLFQMHYRSERRTIEFWLNNTARRVRGPWPEAMGATHGIAGRWAATYATQIEFFVRYQQSANMFVGANLIGLRDSMITAAVHAVEGNWNLIGSDHQEIIAAVKARRWKLAIRRLLAIALPSVTAFVFAKFVPELASPYRSLIIVTCIAYAGVQVLSLIDPDFSARVDLATKLAGMVKR